MKYNKKHLLLTTCIALSLAACSPKKTAEEYIQSAKTHVAEGKSAAAILELKNAVSIDLQNTESRYLLGSLYLELGDVAAAEKELMRSLELNGSKELILPKLFKALNLQDKSEKVLTLSNQILPIPESILPEILLYKALAYIKMEDNEKATETIAQASEISSGSVYSQLGEAYLMAESTNENGALDLIEDVLLKQPELIEALILKGQLLFIEDDFENAIHAFNEFHRLLPSNIQVRLFLANSYIRNNQYKEAEEHLDFLLKIIPEHAFTNQLKGLVYYQKDDFENALTHTNKAIQNGLNIPSNRIIAGLSAFKLEQYERAHHFLITIAESLPPTHAVRRILAVVQLRLGYSTEAGETLQVMSGATADDIDLLTAASFELLKAGKFEDAKALVTKTNNISTSDPKDIAKVGILKLSMNDLEGLSNLEKALEIDPELAIAKIALVAAYIQTKEYDKALNLAEQWKTSNPEQVGGYNLAAKIQLLKNDSAAAEVEFNLALLVNENNADSLLYFAKKAITAEKPEESIKQLDKLLMSAPNNLSALTLSYRAHKLLNTTDVAIKSIAQAFSENENNISYRILYSRVLFIEERFADVINLLEKIEDGASAPALQWLLLGDSYLKLNKNEKALTVYDDWIKAQPQYRIAWLRKVSTQENIKDYNGALLTVEQALVKAPSDEQFTILRANYLISTKKFSEAQEQIDELTGEQKKLASVKGLQGKMWLTEGKFEKALVGLKELYVVSPSYYNTALLFTTYRKLGKENIAFDFIKKHVSSHPEDVLSKNLLAESAITYEPALAKEHYLVLLEATPDNFLILNNLAWIEYKLSNYIEADKFINSALKLNAQHPQVLDTAGLIQFKLGNKQKAIELLNKAKLLAPNDEQIAIHYKEVTSHKHIE